MTSSEASILELVHRVSQIGAERFGRLSIDGITTRQLCVMQAISAAPGASQSALIAATRVDRSTLSAVIRILEQRGYVMRGRRHDDMRAYRVKLTPLGEEMLVRLSPALEQVEEKLLSELTAAERATLIGLLRRVTEVRCGSGAPLPGGVASDDAVDEAELHEAVGLCGVRND